VGWMFHNQRVLSNPDSVWDGISYIAPSAPGNGGSRGIVLVDPGGTFHLFEREFVEIEADSCVQMVHYFGTPGSPGVPWSPAATRQVLDTWPDTVEGFLLGGTGASGEGARGGGAIVDSLIYVAWDRLEGSERHVVFAMLNTSSGEWTPSLPDENDPWPHDPLSLADGINAVAPLIAASQDDGTVHLVWHEPDEGRFDIETPPDTTRLYHRYNRNVEADSSWSDIVEVVPEREKEVKRPALAALGTELYVAYQSTENELTSESNGKVWQAWFRKGEVIADMVAADSTVTWDGAVYLDRDFLVEEGGVLQIEPGTRIFAKADTARGANYGADSSLVELVVRGTLLAGSDSGDPVEFATYDADGSGDDEWGGLLFQLAGAYESSYGFFAAVNPVSRLDNVQIEDSAYGVRIAGNIAPGLVDVTFTNIGQDRHIVLDSVDVVIPEVRMRNDHDTESADYNGIQFDMHTDEAIWDLTGPVLVAATKGVHSAGDTLVFGADTLATLIVQGRLITHPGGSDERVRFTSLEGDADGLGDEWDGIFIDTPAAGSNLAHAEVEHAKTGVMVFFGDDVTIECSHIHDCGDIGVHVYGSGAGGVVVDGNTIERGASMDPQAGNECLVVEQADQCTVTENLLELGEIEEGELGAC